MSEISNQCREFVDGIQHPNERVLAKEILEGKTVGEFSLAFDQSQVDAMTDRLRGAGCFDKPTPTPAELAEEEPAEEVAPEATEDAPEGDSAPEVPANDEAPADAGEATPEAGDTPAETPVDEVPSATETASAEAGQEAPAEEETPKTDTPA